MIPTLRRDSTLWIIIGVCAFPLCLGIQLALGIHLYYTLAAVSVFVYYQVMRCSAIFMCLVLEKLIPWQNLKFEKNEIKTDIIFYIANNFIIVPGLGLLTFLLIRKMIATYPLLVIFNISAWPKWLFYTTLFLVMELGGYCGHRFIHANMFAWRGHATHHVPTKIYWLNNLRNNFLSYNFSMLFIGVPSILLGAPAEFLIIREAIFILLGPFQHVNADLRMGFLNYIFSAAPNHRFHHSRKSKEANANFGLMLAIFDIVFGTFIHGDLSRKQNIEMGLFRKIDGYKKHDFIFQETIPYRQSFWKKTPAYINVSVGRQSQLD